MSLVNLDYYENHGSNLNSHNLGNRMIKFYITKKLVSSHTNCFLIREEE